MRGVLVLLFLISSKLAMAAFIPPPPITGGGVIRSIPVSYITYINTNSNDSGIYISLALSNLSDVDVILNNVNLTVSIYYYTLTGSKFEVKNPPSFDRYVINNDGSISSSNRPSLPDIITPQATSILSTVFTPRKTQFYVSLTTPPYVGVSLANFTNTINGNDYGGGDYIGYLSITGTINVSDKDNKPGFLFGYGSIIKPSSMGTANTATTTSFVLNGGKPL